MTTTNGASSSRQPPAAGPSHYSEIPQDARLISLIIASMGIQDIEPGVEMMLLEWAHRYIHTILSDSLLYASHAHPSSSSNPQISLADVTLAVQSHLSHSLIQPPSKSALLNLASSLNSTPLPPISDRYGLRLPPKEHCLTNVNFNIVPDALDDEDDEEDGDGEDERDEEQRGAGAAVGEADADDTATAGAGDVTMTEEGTTNGRAAADEDDAAGRGVKRSLEEDDEYD
ncbi:TFIID-31kDa-domain-containing protein [Jaminaea rosea]|uniref:TFIID-31kDa-domain-containing protein n=1 Tax=Jaminaea rosea TaxID=1569628 RepID=A0A316V205_9BASI|nr:TFIID-31kDa-domain-containing protein [Jaminaea rosea]PWN30213.1 TFIID-31kDa-domain-containing protein [Jaminaea rosea]